MRAGDVLALRERANMVRDVNAPSKMLGAKLNSRYLVEWRHETLEYGTVNVVASVSKHGVAAKTLFRIADDWGLGRQDLATILAASPRSIDRWKSGTTPGFNRDQLERISYVLAIYGGLHAIFGESPIANTWVNAPNADFGGRAPIGRMLDGNVGDLAQVSDYVAGWRAG